jgi:hypothetical protein
LSIELLNRRLPNGIEALIVWLSAIGSADTEKPSGSALPFYMVDRPSTSDDEITQTGIYVVHSFDKAHDGYGAMYNAYLAADLAQRRMLALCPRFGNGQQPVTLSDGTVIYSDGVKTMSGPTRVQYTKDNSIERYTIDFEVKFRYIAA